MLKLIYSPEYEVDIGAHVFPTAKYRMIREMLLEEKTVAPENFILPEPATDDELLLAITPELLDDLKSLRRSPRTLYSELPLTEAVVTAYILSAGGTIVAAREALSGPPHIACHIGGGFHHAFADHAEGFCYINDIAVAVRVMQQQGRITRAAVIDCDLHQGNGTAKIFQGDDSVLTMSIHQENNYPPKMKSDIDIGLHDYTDDTEYLSHLHEALLPMLDDFKPELIIYVAGADPYQDDVLGQLKLTIHGLAERDEMVLSEAVKRKIPIVTVCAGGYAQHVTDTVRIHAQTCQIAAKLAKTAAD